MATYYVDYKNGSDSAAGGSGTPWKTTDKAHNTINAGDTVVLRGNATDSTTYYPASLAIRKASTWEAASGHVPTFDGGFEPEFGNYSTYTLGSSRPGSINNSMITIRADNVTLTGIRLQNIGGNAISISNGDNTLIDGCIIDTTYGAGIIVAGEQNNRIADIEIRDCQILNTSFAAPISEQLGRNAVMLRGCEDLWFHDNLVAYSYKEGVNVDRGGLGTIIENNTIHTINHSAIYLNRTVDCHIRYNIIYHTKVKEFLGAAYKKRTSPTSIKIGDESGPGMTGNHNSSQQRVYGNVVIGGASCIHVACNEKQYQTQLNQAYIGYNTLIGETWVDDRGISKTQNVIEIGDNTLGPGDHIDTLIENNIFYAPTGVKLARLKGTGGITWRNNAWYSADGASAPTAARSGTDVTASPLLVDPTKKFIEVYPATTGAGFSLGNYQLKKGSPLIGAASNRSRAGNVTPPTVTPDIAGNARSDEDAEEFQFYDIGALESGASPPDPPAPPAHTVDADFTQSATSGAAPLSVTFIDTSETTGSAAIDWFQWDYGNGVTETEDANPTYVYNQSGTFTPKLTVRDTTRNIADTKTGSAITVTTTRNETNPGAMSIVRFAAPTVDGTTKTVTFSLKGHAPAAVLFFLAKPTTPGNVDGAVFCMGGVTATGQWAHAVSSTDNVATAATKKYSTNRACAVALVDGVLSGEMKLKRLAPDKVVLDVVDGFPAGYLITAVGIGGAGYAAMASDFWLDVEGSVTQLVPGFGPEIWLTAGVASGNWGNLVNNADFHMGMADGATQLGFAWRDFNAYNDTRLQAGITSDSIIKDPISGAAGVLASGAKTITVQKDDILRRYGYMALDLPSTTSAVVKQFSTPTSTGNQSYSLGFRPDGVLITLSGLSTLGGVLKVGAQAEGFSVVAADGGGTYSTGIASDHNAATSNTKSLVSNNVKLIDGAGTTILEGTLTIDSDGFDINWTTVQSTARYFNVLGIGSTPVTAGPIAHFDADDTTPEDGVVEFTDLSSANGAAITEWDWNFGDGSFSTEQHPEHRYREYGTYTVTLTVTNANGENTRTRQNFIAYTRPASWLVGPYEPRTITNYTTNKLYGDEPGDVHYGFVEHALNLDGLTIDADPLDTSTAVAGKVRFVMDRDNNRLLVIYPDGTNWAIDFDAA